MRNRIMIVVVVACSMVLGCTIGLMASENEENEEHEHEHEHEEGEHHSRGGGEGGKKVQTLNANDQQSEGHGRHAVTVVSDPLYKTECGSCHMVYPPGLLPERSWRAIMKGLKDHFGENATLDKATSEKITRILVEQAADHSSLRRSQKIAASIRQSAVPLRISETQYFIRQHHEVGPSIWRRKAVASPANCGACHPGAEKGVFSEDEIKIPK